VIKLASNTSMYERLLGDMDINCGIIAEGKSTVEEMGAVIFQKILETASGKKTQSELLGYGDNEFAPWQCGVVV
jgi:altronate hydrolase